MDALSNLIGSPRYGPINFELVDNIFSGFSGDESLHF